jgi:hypothetical protein
MCSDFHQGQNQESSRRGLIDRVRMRNGDGVPTNVRHAAALALAVWYLIGPPEKSGSDNDLKAPLGKWKIIDNYTDVAACEQGRIAHLSEWYDRADSDGVGTKAAINDARMLVWIDEAKCVSADDPSLKSNSATP